MFYFKKEEVYVVTISESEVLILLFDAHLFCGSKFDLFTVEFRLKWC